MIRTTAFLLALGVAGSAFAACRTSSVAPDETVLHPDLSGASEQWRQADASDCWVWLNRRWIAASSIGWSGGCKDRLASGRGTLVVMWEGYGTVTVRGEFRRGALNGKGSIAYTNAIAEGEFRNGELNGRGRRRFENGTQEEGTFVQGRLTGQGTVRWTNGAHYEGPLDAGLFNGVGKLTWQNGDRYNGPFDCGLEEGRGTYTWADGSVLETTYRHGRISGESVLRRRDGTTIRGEATPPSDDAAHPAPAPVYPVLSIRLNEEGYVLIGYHVGKDGTVRDVFMMRTSGSARLDEAALAAFSTTSRVPGKIGDTPIEMNMRRSIVFFLH